MRVTRIETEAKRGFLAFTNRPFLLPTAAAAAFSSFSSPYGRVMLSEKEASWSGVGRLQSSGIGMNSASSSSCWTIQPVAHFVSLTKREGVLFHRVTTTDLSKPGGTGAVPSLVRCRHHWGL